MSSVHHSDEQEYQNWLIARCDLCEAPFTADEWEKRVKLVPGVHGDRHIACVELEMEFRGISREEASHLVKE